MTLAVDWTSSARPHKAEVRTALLGSRMMRNAVFLPGNEALCVREAVASGLLTEGSTVYAVERDPETMTAIRKRLKTFPGRAVFHEGDLSTLRPEGEIDYALVDLMGGLDIGLANWMRRIVDLHASADFEMSLVVAMNWRNNHFMEHVVKETRNTPGMWRGLEDEFSLSLPYVISYLAVLKSIFHDYEVSFKAPIRYGDSKMTMLAFRLHGFKRLDEPTWPDFAAGFVKTFAKDPDRPRPTTEKTMSKPGAGKKAWETRRKNEDVRVAQAAKDALSDRAKRAWKTRRAGEPQISAGSAAALKAWETRRANGWVHPAHR